MDFKKTISRRQASGYLAGGILATTAAAFLPSRALAEEFEPVAFSGNDAFEILENDHQHIHHHLTALIETPHTRRATLAKLIPLFAVHNTTEESLIYPAIQIIAKRVTDAKTLFHQQDEAKVVVWQLNEMLRLHPQDNDAFTDLATKLRAGALSHVKLEESTEFPALRAALTSKERHDLTLEVQKFRKRFA